LGGRNLIITGANGSGKTSFLKEVYEKVRLHIVQKQGILLQALLIQDSEYENYKNERKLLGEHIGAINNGLDVIIHQSQAKSDLYQSKQAIILFFEEKRLSEIARPTTPKSISQEEEEAKKQDTCQKHAGNLEQHLVNLTSRQSLAITKDKNQALANEIEIWFNDFEKNLKILFEDESTKLEFDSDTFSFEISQSGKPPFTFQTLSAGYRAIFDIYAELIMHTEYFKIMPADLTGVVFIDEIDSHLHVSLQRLILPFFAKSFPKIQFIVTTHSPYVLMSAAATYTPVFDLGKNYLITEHHSYYTYSAVMKGLWNVKPISKDLEMKIKDIARIINSHPKDIAKLQALTEDVRKHADALDNESKALYLLGLETLQEAEEKAEAEAERAIHV
jgi:AAA15 family ATPase/GTPase